MVGSIPTDINTPHTFTVKETPQTLNRILFTYQILICSVEGNPMPARRTVQDWMLAESLSVDFNKKTFIISALAKHKSAFHVRWR